MCKAAMDSVVTWDTSHTYMNDGFYDTVLTQQLQHPVKDLQ